MKLLMPSHVRRVQQYVDPVPVFQRYGVEDQLTAMYQPVVQLKSGGYLVINPTEALVSIDINSGRSTREHNIEQTAFATNLEAAAEIARQLRLRDMAGLIVIDFIDMEQSSHVRKVEKAMKDALKNDRARIQVGRISAFGLMEMSRQRLRTGVLEASTKPCPHCEGTGLMRTASSAGLSALRIIEDEATRGRGEKILLRAGRDAAVYVLNKKRTELADIEQRYGVSIEVMIDEAFEGARMTVESSGPRPIAPERPAQVPIVEDEDEEVEAAMVGAEDFAEEEEEEAEQDEEARGEEGDRPGRRRRRRRRGGRGRNRRDSEGGSEGEPSPEGAAEDEIVEEALPSPVAEEPAAEGGKRRRRRRGRKPGAEAEAGTEAEGETAVEVEPDSSPMVERPVDEEPPIAETEPAEEAKPKKRTRKKAAAAAEPAPPEAPPAETAEDAAPAAKPARKRRTKAEKAAEEAAEAAPAPPPPANNDSEATDENGEPRRGWWQRTFG
jgi:ribonuclease E